VSKNVIVVGGGIAGLTAAIYLARGGCRVTIFEKKPYLGGRAITHLRKGFRFNLGPHAVYRAGTAAQVYRELGVPIRGGSPKRRGTAIVDGERHKLPVSLLSLLTTGLLSGKAKMEAASLMFRLRRLDTKPFESITVREWLDTAVSNERLRQVMASLVRLATYSADETQSAAAGLEQLKLIMRGGVIYVDEGWQKIVDGLHSHAVTSGVNFVTSSRVIGVEHDQSVRAIVLGGLEVPRRNDTMSVALPDVTPEAVKGTRLPVEHVVLAVDPMTADELIGNGFSHAWRQLKPVTVDCLDVALSRLPDRKRTFAIGIDKPLYLSVHSAYAQLTPRGGALIHVAKYRAAPGPTSGADDYDVVRVTEASRADEQELELLLDEMQPGWRDVVVHRRFLPAMTVAHALRTPGTERPSPQTPVRGLYIAGDWVGSEGILSDAALASARAAARAILS
jgi:phytoene dehydrogenase-like protein